MENKGNSGDGEKEKNPISLDTILNIIDGV